MTLVEQAEARIAGAHRLGCDPVRWIATTSVIEHLRAAAPPGMWQGDSFLGVPIAPGMPRSEWGLQLVLRAVGSEQERAA